MTNPKAIIYVRVSDSNQVDGTSLEFQEEECRKFCQRKGMEVVEVFREEGESAKDLSLHNREVFMRALEFCRKNKGQVQAFVVLRVDRFARNTEDHFAVRKILMDYGVTLHSVTETIGNSPAEKFIETVLAGAAEYDNAIRKKRCVDGMAAKLRQGIYPWHPPLGYRPVGSKKRGEKKTEPDRPEERIFTIIQRGLKEYAQGRCSQSELARRLDQWGLAEARGRKTRPQIVDWLLGRYLKFYTGVLVDPWTREEYRGLHQPMISQEEYHRIRLVRAGRSFNVKRDRHNPLFPLRRTVTCAASASWLTGSVSRGNGGQYAYYHCPTRGCPYYGKGIPKDALEAEFLKHLEGITPKEQFLVAFRETVLDLWEERRRELEAGAGQWNRSLAGLEQRRKRIFEMREDGSYSREEFQERREEVENQIAAANIALSECRIDQFDVEAVLAYASRFILDLPRQWFDLPAELRPRFQRLVFPEGIPYDRKTGFGTAKLGLIYELNRQSAAQKSYMVLLLGISWNQLLEELRLFEAVRRGEDHLQALATA
jgi:site-specific DNA recombinase